MKKTYMAITLLLFSMLLFGCKVKEPEVEEIRFVVIPGEEQQLESIQPLADYLTEETGANIKLIIATDYTATVEAIRYGHAEMAWLGPFTYIMAAEMMDITPLVGGVKKGAELTYNSIIFTRADSGIETLEDIKGKTFAFCDPGSTSGYLVPMYGFKMAGIEPTTDFKATYFAGSHTATQLAVFNGQADAAASNLPTYQRMVDERQIDPEVQKIIWTSEPIPPSPVVIRSDIDPELIAKIQQAFLDTKDKIGDVRGTANKLHERFEIVEDSDYDVLRDIATELGLDPTELE